LRADTLLRYYPLRRKEVRKSRVPEFWDRVKITTPSECWLWAGPVSVYGYGVYSKKISEEQKVSKPAHREAYERTFGEIPDGQVIRHSCDNRKCCNPGHLSAGTHADNVLDKVSRNRQSRGETMWNHLLKERNVKQIRRLGSIGMKQKDLAKMFKICRPSISKIINKKAWKHV
jgi:predicted XRE-type DNA-binding protein